VHAARPLPKGPFVNSLRSRRLIALLSLALALAVSACSGGDAIPSDPAEDAGAGAPGEAGGDTGTGTLGGDDGTGQAPEGLNEPMPDTGDDLEEPTP
jgi:hypothetical protein